MRFEEFTTLLQASNKIMQSFTAKERVIFYSGGSILSSNDGIQEYVDTTPSPIFSFGRKVSWLAIQGNDHRKVADYLNRYSRPILETNWEKGLDGAYHHFCFVSPPINNWIFVVNPNLLPIHLPAGQEALSNLSKMFGEVHFYAHHRGTAYCAFAKFVQGRLQRGCSQAGGTTYLNTGELTPIERQLIAVAGQRNANDPEQLAYLAEDKGVTALLAEESLAAIAGDWSIDPTALHLYDGMEAHAAALGYVFKDVDTKMIREVMSEKTRVLKLAVRWYNVTSFSPLP